MRMNISITIPLALKNLGNLIQLGLTNGVNRATTYVNQQAVSNAPRISGTLKRSIHSEVSSLGGTLTGKIIQDSGIASYGKFVEEGTGLYGPKHQVIYPTNSKVLSWMKNGSRIFARSIKGMVGRFYMKKTFDESQDKVGKIITEEINKTINVGR